MTNYVKFNNETMKRNFNEQAKKPLLITVSYIMKIIESNREAFIEISTFYG